MKKIYVLGAGFAGLTVALRLAQKGFEVEIHEQSSRCGGLLGTDQTAYGIAERAANAMIRTSKAEQLFAELGITPSHVLESSKKRFIFREMPRKWPLSFFETLQFVTKLGSKLFRGKKTVRPSEQETLETWGHKNLGFAATRFLLGPAMQGIYANELSGLSSQLILSPLFAPKREKYRGLLTGPGGMQDLINQLENKLIDAGVKIHLNSSILLENIQGPVVIATSAAAAGQVTNSKYPELSAILSRVRMTSLISATLFFSKAQSSYKGFGCLIPRGFGLKTFGILMNSYIFKDRDQTYNETWILGGVQQEELLQLGDSDLLKLLAQERFAILKQKDSLLDFKINRWKNALPYYDLTLETVQKDLKSIETPDLYLHGNYLSGIGLSKILERSDEIARQIGTKYG